MAVLQPEALAQAGVQTSNNELHLLTTFLAKAGFGWNAKAQRLKQRFFEQQKWVYLRIFPKNPMASLERMDHLKDFVGSFYFKIYYIAFFPHNQLYDQVQEFDPDVVAGGCDFDFGGLWVVFYGWCEQTQAEMLFLICPAMSWGHNAYSCDLDILAARFHQPASESRNICISNAWEMLSPGGPCDLPTRLKVHQWQKLGRLRRPKVACSDALGGIA